MGFKMKRIVCLILVLVVINQSFINTQFVSADLAEGDEFVFEIKKANHYFEIGSFKSVTEGFYFGRQNLSENSLINARVDSIGPARVRYSFSVDNITRLSFVTFNWLDYFGPHYGYNILYHIFNIFNDPYYGVTLNSYIYKIKPYINPEVTNYLLTPESLGEDLRDSFHDNYKYPDIECKYNTNTENDIVYFESWIGGKLDTNFGKIINDEQDYPTSIKFDTNFHYKIDRNTGMTLGLGQRGWVKGTINNTFVKASMELEYVLQGQTLSGYSYGRYRDFSNKIYLYILIPTICSVIIITIVVSLLLRRKKKNKLD